MSLPTSPASSSRIASRLIHSYPTGFAWAAEDSRFGRYLMSPYKSSEPIGLVVVDDFGNLVAVPSTGVNARTLIQWAIAALVALLLSTSYLLDGPDDIATAQAVADDLASAQAVRP